ncbi:hypothetical protein pb186bvf_019920 [Paramecium bursaria]
MENFIKIQGIVHNYHQSVFSQHLILQVGFIESNHILLFLILDLIIGYLHFINYHLVNELKFFIYYNFILIIIKSQFTPYSGFSSIPKLHHLTKIIKKKFYFFIIINNCFLILDYFWSNNLNSCFQIRGVIFYTKLHPQMMSIQIEQQLQFFNKITLKMMPPQYSVQQTQFQSPPVLYSQSQPMMVTNQNNMTYQMVNLGAGAIAQRMQQRQQEEMLIDLLGKQGELISQLNDVMDWKARQKEQEWEDEIEELERKQIILRQKKAEADYIYKLNRQMNFGLERIKEQQIKNLVYPKPVKLGMKVPSVALLEEVEQVYPNPRFHRKEYQDQEIQADFNNPYQKFVQEPPMFPPIYEPQFNQQRPSQLTTQKRGSQNTLQKKSSQQSLKTPLKSQKDLSQSQVSQQSQKSKQSGNSQPSQKSQNQ